MRYVILEHLARRPFPGTFILKIYQRLEAQLRPLATYRVDVKDGDIWVDLE